MKRILCITLFILLFLSGCSHREKIDIKLPSYMFSENSELYRELEVSLKGSLNKNNAYEGALSINDMVFEHVTFMHSSSLIS
ncbi:hypothetical protein PAECIP112173_03806 [Paenibacillus sp. JJ-100]|nr:hypothetical protein PAECIP112173_03806 [Paenibacillus sp. JJ-100]